MPKILESDGLKREIAGIIQSLILVISPIPGLGFLVPILTVASAILGGTGLIHAGILGSFLNRIFSTLASVLAIAILIAAQIPAALPYIPLMQKLAALLGAAGYVSKK